MKEGSAPSRGRSLLLALIILAGAAMFAALIIINTAYWPLYALLLAIIGAGYYILLKKGGKTQDDMNLSGIETTLTLADKTFLYLKDGLDSESALFVAQIIKDISNIPAVALTDRKNVLAFIGEGCSKRTSGTYPIKTQATLDAVADGKMRIIKSSADFDCREDDCHCEMSSVVIVPLFDKTDVVGCIKFYGSNSKKMRDENIKQAVGIGKLLSMQIELASYDRQVQLNTEAKLDALQAQINPHFLFNTLNTIKMYINKDTEYARQLIVSLATMLRYLLGKFGRFITLEKEISYIEEYIAIEKARYLDRLSVEFVITENIENVEVPVLCIQPIVHNAIIHGILPKDGKGKVVIKVTREGDELLISIQDDGVGMNQEEVKKAYLNGYGSGCGIGISNVNERLKILYGESHGLKIESEYMKGTTVTLRIPI